MPAGKEERDEEEYYQSRRTQPCRVGAQSLEQENIGGSSRKAGAVKARVERHLDAIVVRPLHPTPGGPLAHDPFDLEHLTAGCCGFVLEEENEERTRAVA